MSVDKAELFRDGELIRHFGCHVRVGRQFGERECHDHPSSDERVHSRRLQIGSGGLPMDGIKGNETTVPSPHRE